MYKLKAFRTSQWIMTLGILNFMLFVFISMIIGGDALNGRIENGHYYLGGGGRQTTVPYIVFLYSNIHAYTVIFSWPILMIAGCVSLATWPEKSGFLYAAPSTQITPADWLPRIIFTLRTAFWRIIDKFEGLFSLLLDSWRKPDVEFFTKFPYRQCLKILRFEVESSPDRFGKAVFAYLLGTNFWLMKTPSRSTRFLYRGPFLALTGQLRSTPHGTYVRAWHRFPSASIFTISLALGLALVFVPLLILPLHPVVREFLQPDSSAVWILLIAVPASFVLVALFFLYIGAKLGRSRDGDLRSFLEEALDDSSYTPSLRYRAERIG